MYVHLTNATLKTNQIAFRNFTALSYLHILNFPSLFDLFSDPGTINVVRINTDPGRGELVMHVERLLGATDSLFISPVTMASY